MTANEVVKKYAGQWVRATHTFGGSYYDVLVIPNGAVNHIKVIFKDGFYGYLSMDRYEITLIPNKASKEEIEDIIKRLEI